MGIDEDFFKPSIPADRTRRQIDSFADLGSLPSTHRHGRQPDQPQQTYGSLSTFHGDGALGTSPLSALRAVPVPGSDTSSPAASPRISNIDPVPPHSMPIGGYGSKAAKPFVRPIDGPSRRPSVSFQNRHPFKAGSLSGSSVPRTHDSDSPASLNLEIDRR
jgi:autophagy-related protein 13